MSLALSLRRARGQVTSAPEQAVSVLEEAAHDLTEVIAELQSSPVGCTRRSSPTTASGRRCRGLAERARLPSPSTTTCPAVCPRPSRRQPISSRGSAHQRRQARARRGSDRQRGVGRRVARRRRRRRRDRGCRVRGGNRASRARRPRRGDLGAPCCDIGLTRYTRHRLDPGPRLRLGEAPATRRRAYWRAAIAVTGLRRNASRVGRMQAANARPRSPRRSRRRP